MQEKKSFIEKHKIDFIDLISEVKVEVGQEINYDDRYIDSRVTEWRDVIAEIEQLKKLKRICLTRKTVSDIPKMKERIEKIKEHCASKKMKFQMLTTPARFYNTTKQAEWNNFLLL